MRQAPSPRTPYGLSKLEGERIVQATPGLRWTILRPGVVYGPGDRAMLPLFKLARRGVLPLVGRSDAAYTFVHVSDVVRVIAAAIDQPAEGDTLFVGHPTAVTPREILEAARMDGATIGRELIYVLTPMAIPGLASTMLLNLILAWNEAFWTLNLSTSNAAPLTTFIASYSSPEGLFWAKLSAASTLAIAPILVLGWFSQKQLVRGLTFGAVK